jgi:hypothetical protein
VSSLLVRFGSGCALGSWMNFRCPAMLFLMLAMWRSARGWVSSIRMRLKKMAPVCAGAEHRCVRMRDRRALHPG